MTYEWRARRFSMRGSFGFLSRDRGVIERVVGQVHGLRDATSQNIQLRPELIKDQASGALLKPDHVLIDSNRAYSTPNYRFIHCDFEKSAENRKQTGGRPRIRFHKGYPTPL